MSNAPPSYNDALKQQPAGNPAVSVTDYGGGSSTGLTAEEREAAQARAAAHHGNDSDDEDDVFLKAGLSADDRKSFDDEIRELPKGWVRCWDEKQQHHFYVDEATKRSTWNHPYDDPEYLQSLPDTHPANPNSAEAKAARAHAEELQRQHDAETHGHEGKGKQKASRNFLQKMKDKAIGTKEERAEYKRQQDEAERRALQQYVARRKALIEQQRNNPQLANYYASPYDVYGPPAGRYARQSGMLYPRYGYGGGYGYGYGGMGMGMPLMAGAAGGLLMGGMLGAGF